MKLVKKNICAYVRVKSEGPHAYIPYTLFVICFQRASRRREIKENWGSDQLKLF